MNDTPNQPMNDTPNQPMNDTPNQPMNDTPNLSNHQPKQLMNDTPNQPMNDTPNQPMNDTPNQPMNDTPNLSNHQPQETMNDKPEQPMTESAPFKLPATFNLCVSLHHSTIYHDENDLDNLETDFAHMYYRVSIFCEGKLKSIHSPIFSADQQEANHAYRCLLECIADTLARSVLPKDQCPQYEIVNGVCQPK